MGETALLSSKLFANVTFARQPIKLLDETVRKFSLQVPKSNHEYVACLHFLTICVEYESVVPNVLMVLT